MSGKREEKILLKETRECTKKLSIGICLHVREN